MSDFELHNLCREERVRENHELSTKGKAQYTATCTLGQLGERRSVEREVAGSNPGRTNTQCL